LNVITAEDVQSQGRAGAVVETQPFTVMGQVVECLFDVVYRSVLFPDLAVCRNWETVQGRHGQ
jgi:hypothetical protein